MNRDLASRLRWLRQENGWTTAEMSYRCSIPKRTLEKYMLRDGASLPGVEALAAMSKGFGVSLDWLVFGSEIAGETIELLVNRSAAGAGTMVFETLLRYNAEGGRPIFSNDEILNMTVEQWAAEIGLRAGEIAKELAAKGQTKEQLLLWKQSQQDRLSEIVRDKFEMMLNADIGAQG